MDEGRPPGSPDGDPEGVTSASDAQAGSAPAGSAPTGPDEGLPGDPGPDGHRWQRRGVALVALALLGAGVGTYALASGGEGPDRSTAGTAGTTPATTTPGTSATTAPTTGTTTPATTGTTPATTPAPGDTSGGTGMTASGMWRPTAGMSWQWQLDGGPIDMSVEAEVYDVDLFATPVSEIQELQGRGRRVICYFSAGSWEPYRPDAGDFPESVLGGPVEGWEDERWVDIRQLDVLRPLIASRLDLCAAKGADGAEPDWMDSYVQDTGWPITADDQLAFNHMVADLAHERGLAIGLKNNPGQAGELADTFDFVVVEQCAEFGECGEYVPFLDRDKPVFHAEYDLPTSEFCAESRRLGLSSIRKRLELDAWRETC